MRDVFYIGIKPNLFPHEREVDSIEQACQWSRTEFCWVITYLADYTGWDWLWVPPPWQAHQRHAWASQWQKDSGTYLIPRAGYTDTNYHAAPVITRRPHKIWRLPDNIDLDSFDFSWHPDPTEPDYEYHFGTQWQDTGGPVYPGTAGHKIIDSPRAHALPDRSRWIIPDNIDPNSFDFSWHPDILDPPYEYHFGTQWQDTGGPVYPGTAGFKSIHSPRASALSDRSRWIIPDNIDPNSFDFSWHPDSRDPPYEYHFGTQWQSAGGPVYPGTAGIKFQDQPRAKALPDRTNWVAHEHIDENAWDWSWHPDPHDPALRYVWGNQWWSPVDHASISYQVPGAVDTRYMEQTAQRLPHPGLFECRLPVKQFDFSWMPNPRDPAMTYVWGNEWNPAEIEPTVIYHNGADTIKYMHDQVAKLEPNTAAWTILDDIESFDYSWRPNPLDPAYKYVFGNQWLLPEVKPALCYEVPGATEIKYMDWPRALRRAEPHKFVTHRECEFDYSWEPDPGDPAYIYVFGNQWYPAEIMPTVEYTVPGATERKFVSEPQARLTGTNDDHWHTRVDCDWDYTWVPDPGDPVYIYVFGNQWHSAEIMPTVEYHVPGATERKYMSEPRAQLKSNTAPWTVSEFVDDTNIDFSWVPDPGSPPYIYHFGDAYQSSIGLIYTVPGATEIKFAGEIPRLDQQRSAMITTDIFYLDRSNTMSQARFARLQERYPHIQKVRYANSTMDTIRRCMSRTKQNRFWVISSLNVYDDFDFDWHPETWQTGMTHVFGSQWNKWSDTFLITRWEFDRHARWAKGIEEFPNLNFVSNCWVTAPADAAPIYVIDHGNYLGPDLPAPHVPERISRFYDSYLETLRRVIQDIEHEHIWVVSTVCDYSHFDFSWQPEVWQRDMLHVFPSGSQKFGDTFYVPVRALRDRIDDLAHLEWFETVNFCEDQRVERYHLPVIQHHDDCHVDAVKKNQFVGPAAIFTNYPEVEPLQFARDSVNLWEPQTRAVVSLDAGNQRIIVPRETAVHVRDQIYDYPYIDTKQRQMSNQPLDIVFIGNGESCEKENYTRLLWTLVDQGKTRGEVHRITGINGRVAAYHAAARASTTPWFFAVFAKINVDENFDWLWQPDRMQRPKHYIFHAYNPVIRLTYGHQAVIAYNRDMVLSNPGIGLDFTLDQPHEVVPILSGTATYTENAWMAWRTAFREVLKLRHSLPDVENQYRLDRWLSCSNGPYGEWSQYGAQDAVEYYEEVAGDFDQLKKSYEWQWLASYALLRRNLTADQ